MFLKELKLNNFRVFSELELKFHPTINIIYGSNGQGKTSILESIYYSSLTKSFRAKKDKTALRHETEFFDIKSVFVDKQNIEKNIRLFYSESEGKHAFINNERAKKFSEFIGNFPVVLLSLEDLDLTFGQPASRRKFLDILLSQLYPNYLINLQKYKRCIAQKNKLLNTENNFKILQIELDIWNQQLVTSGVELIKARKRFIKYLNENISTVYTNIAKTQEKIFCNYMSNVFESNNNSQPLEIEKSFLKALENNSERELKRQISLVGPHRDDIEFLKDGFPFKTHGSQGENKSFLLALKLIESDYVVKESDKNPLILLDDIFGELDNDRIKNLLKIILSKGQTFITTTDKQKFIDIIKEKESLFYLSDRKIFQ